MRQKTILGLLLIVFLSAPSVASAESGISTSLPDAPVVQEKRDAMRQEIKNKREEFKAKVQEHREEMKAAIQSRREAFKRQLQAIRDEKKQAIAERIDARFTTINQNRTDRMAAALDTFTEILARLTNRIEEAAATGTDTTAAEAAIAEAQKAIATAKTTVTTQAGITYIAEIANEASLGTSFQTTFTQLKTDLETAHAAVKAAKQALKVAFSEVAKLEKISNNEDTVN